LKISRLVRRNLGVGVLCVAVAAAIGAGLIYFRSSQSWKLPYRDSFATGQANEWTAFGGTWRIADGAIRNDSDERGAKIMTGSPNWKDYSFSADVELLGIPGDAGLILRSSDEEEGVDSYRGYYVGLRNNDGNLIIGFADHGWIELAAQPMPGGVHALREYHLKGAVHGCQISAYANEIPDGAVQTVSYTDRECLTKGRIGLRSHSSGGAWKNLLVLSLSGSASQSAQTGPHAPPPNLPYAVDEPVIQRGSNPERPVTRTSSVPTPGHASSEGGVEIAATVENIGGLRMIRTVRRHATVRGTVILTRPRLYVQDATGGVEVVTSSEPYLKVGDEVEVSGEVEVHDFSCVLRSANIRLLWAHTPAPPVAVTASQAATGAFDARFIEVEGLLSRKEKGPDNTLLLDIKSNGQSFRAIVSPSRSDAILRHLNMQSFLKLRGVCVVDPQFTHNLTSFVLLIASTDDVEELTGPPWWSARNLLIIGLISVTLALLAYLLYIHAKHWRLQAIVEERERIAHEMHDTLAQCFVGIGFQLQAISNGMPKSMHAINKQLDLACELVRHSHEEASRSLSTLRREFLESEPLHSALNAFACRMVEHGSIKVLTTVEGEGTPTPYRIKDALFRIGQEAIANAVRHGNPSVLRIQVDYRNAAVMMLIADDGSGFTPSGDLRGFGLTGMRKRAEGISGALHLSSTIGSGTHVKVVAPLPPKLALLKVNSYVWRQGRQGGSNDPRNDKKNPYSYRR
jgi:signal transduction histidine kinase